MKKRGNLIVAGIIVTFLVITGIVFINYNNNLKLQISDIKITEDEYIRAMNSQKYDVTQHFIKKYSANITKEFWTKEFNGEYPYKMLADKTIKELKRIHGIYDVAMEKGYVDSVEYKDFLQRLNNENKRREQNIASGKPVYGLSSFTEDLYLEYETDQLQKSYCNNLDNDGMEISLEEVIKYYEENKDRLFIKNDDFNLSFVKVYYASLGLEDGEVAEIKNRMIEISKKVDENNSLINLIEQDELLKGYLTSVEVRSEETSSYAKTIGDVLDIAMDLKTGDITQIIDENGCLYLVQCVERTEYDYIPYEEVMDNIKKIMRETRYDEIVTKRASELEVNDNINKVYNFTLSNLK